MEELSHGLEKHGEQYGTKLGEGYEKLRVLRVLWGR